jgi:hypothetical protein
VPSFDDGNPFFVYMLCCADGSYYVGHVRGSVVSVAKVAPDKPE